MSEADNETKSGLLFAALATLLLLLGLLGLAAILFGDDAISGPNQFALAVCGSFAAALGRWHGISWDEISEAVKSGVSLAVPALFILLAVGSLIGAWAMSGTIVAMIYYGFELINLDYFYVSACVICAIVSVGIGSSWTVVGTLGVGMIGMAEGVGMSSAITAGAVISGAYFGDKISPLSDATNLAAAVTESALFKHIKFALWTAIPALAVALAGFLAIDLSQTSEVSREQIERIQAALGDAYNISLWTLTPLALVLALVIARLPAFLAIISAALFGGLIAIITQPDIVLTFADAPGLPAGLAMIEGVWRALSSGFSIETGTAALDRLLSRGGMASMLETVWLILTALAFGAILERTGMINALLGGMIAFARTTGRLFVVVVTTCFGINVLAADQYIAIALPGRVFAPEFRARGLAPENLSRLIGDSATVTSPLVPWNSCGAYMAAALGVGTLHYLPYAFLNLASPVIAVVAGIAGIGVVKTDERAAL